MGGGSAGLELLLLGVKGTKSRGQHGGDVNKIGTGTWPWVGLPEAHAEPAFGGGLPQILRDDIPEGFGEDRRGFVALLGGFGATEGFGALLGAEVLRGC